MRWLSHLVTATIVLGSATAVVLVAQRNLAKPVARVNFHTYALFRDASKIAVGSPVVIAGVKVGQVEKVGIRAPWRALTSDCVACRFEAATDSGRRGGRNRCLAMRM